MPRGGARPGAGRPKGSRNTPKMENAPKQYPGAETPLAYLLAVMNDPEADPARRDAAARAILPFTHRRLAEAPLTPGELKQHADADQSIWDELLRPSEARNGRA